MRTAAIARIYQLGPIVTTTAILLFAWCAPVAAQRSGGPRERALDLFERSVDHYRAGRFQEAVDLLLEARGLAEEPVLLYNLARAYEGLGELEEAIEAYEGYLEEQPDAQDRGAIEARIGTLREQIAERERLERERALALERQGDEGGDRAAPGAADRESGAGAWPWLVLGAGAAGLGAAAVTGTLALSARDDAVQDPEHRSSRESFRRAEDLATVANVLWAVGGALAAIGAVWATIDLVSGGGEGDGGDDVALTLGPGSVAVRGTLP